MLIFDTRAIGNKLLYFRKKAGLTQAEIAELAGLSDRAYADIERGSVNMRSETLLKICTALHITPNDIFTENTTDHASFQQELIDRLNTCTERQKETALKLLSVYLDSINK
ncbi:MAG: helix-turn-helix transcriptional regulator [Clostridia bacterium]|nr:helix-turn-helix transcriptional regulator [Clostridia bacterium]